MLKLLLLLSKSFQTKEVQFFHSSALSWAKHCSYKLKNEVGLQCAKRKNIENETIGYE
jgi:hypothetical protein